MGASEQPTDRVPGRNCDDLTEAALAVEHKVARMQDAMAAALEPTGDQDEFVDEMIGELDVAPEIEDLRAALGMEEDGTRTTAGKPRKRQDLKGDAAKLKARHERRRPSAAEPADAPPEYRTWHTGP